LQFKPEKNEDTQIMKFTYKLKIIIFCPFLFLACNNPKLNSEFNSEFSPKFEPIFKVNNQFVNVEIQKLIKTKSLFIEGYKTRVDDTLDIFLTVQLINVEILPKNNDSLVAIQKKVASKIKNLLKNPLQFKAYDVVIIQRDTVKSLVGTMTSEEGLSHNRFNASDL
jgi:hypothetical protein